MRMRSLIIGLLAPLGLAMGLATAAAESAEKDWLHTALVEGCIVSLKPQTKAEDLIKAGFTAGSDLDEQIKKRLARGLGGVAWFTLTKSDGAVQIGRASARPICVVIQSKGSSKETWAVLDRRLTASKTPKISSQTGKSVTRDVYSVAAGGHNLWISAARTLDFELGAQGASAVIMVELKKR